MEEYNLAIEKDAFQDCVSLGKSLKASDLFSS